MNITRSIQLGLLLSGFLLLNNFYVALSTLLEAKNSKSSFSATLGYIDVFREDGTATKPGGTFATIYNVYVPFTPEGDFAINRNGEKVPVFNNSRQVFVDVPIDEAGLNRIIKTSIVSMVFFALAFSWVVYEAFQFSRAAQKNEFFLWKNFRRIQTIGFVIIFFGIIQFIMSIKMDIVAKMLLGYTGLNPGNKYSMGMLPLWFITGGLLLLIAQGFKKGFDLQRKDDASI